MTPMRAAATAALFALPMLSAPAFGQQGVDMNAVMRWSKAKSVHYRIEGEYRATVPISANKTYAIADVTDRVVVELDWDLRKQVPIGTPKFDNGKSETKNYRNPEKACTPPVAKGPFEYFTIEEVKASQGAKVELKGTRTYPDTDVNVECPASRALKRVPGKKEAAVEYLPVPSPMMMTVGGDKSGKMTVSPDRKSFTMKVGDWSWTYTPTDGPK